jgi:hypothetical protein
VGRVRRGNVFFLAAAGLLGSFAACSSFSSGDPAPAPPADAAPRADGPVETPDAVGPDAGGDATQPQTYYDVVMAAAPLAYWRMGSKTGFLVKDESGHGNDLVLEGAAGGGYVLGAPGAIDGDGDTAIRFDGLNGDGQAMNPRAFDFPETAPFTVEVWAKHEPLEADGGVYFQDLVSHTEGSAGDRAGFALYVVPTSMTETTYSSFDIYGRPNLEQSAVRRPAVAKGVWAHYVGVRDAAGMMTLYVDASASLTVKASGPITGTNAPFVVGGGTSGTGRFFGTIDEVAIYDKALTPAEIAVHTALGPK